MDRKHTVIAFGGVAGFVNTDVELKESPSGSKYVSILLGRGKDQRGNPLPSYQVVLFGDDAKLFANEIKKGDLIRFTSISLSPILDEGKPYASNFRLVGMTFTKIERNAMDEA